MDVHALGLSVDSWASLSYCDCKGLPEAGVYQSGAIQQTEREKTASRINHCNQEHVLRFMPDTKFDAKKHQKESVKEK